ncbi:hypothetical protein [Thermoactinomyces sp. CICC 23799]|uniref:hypothetical protein n=1 Tax=Thermoactinomyces sp. CICC 23799 TaxID=2767429 RepID=UPI0018DC577F|nr:hypothetical protein [Thermoactinomyces sp. CICC 23799]MBH8601198.1 hypothetical protein [Thermoactinomyces sp. CICC 23799]
MREMFKLPEAKIQALRIPKGWTVKHNNLREINPKTLKQDDDKWFYFTQDLLQLEHQEKSILLDLGWYPDVTPEGEFQVQIIQNGNWEQPIRQFTSNDLHEIVKSIEDVLNQITNNRF